MADKQLNYNDIVSILDRADEEDKKNRERRRRRDWLTYMPNALSLVAFGMVVTVWIILDRTNPTPMGTDWGWLSFFGHVPQHRSWPVRPVNLSYIMLIVSMVMCVIAFICNKMRMKRKTDKLSASIFLIGSIALVTFVSFLVKFIPMGILGMW